MIPACKRLQEPIYLLGLFGQFDLHQQLSNGHVNGIPKKGESSHELSQRCFIELVVRESKNTGNTAFGNALFQTTEVFRWRITLFAWGIRCWS